MELTNLANGEEVQQDQDNKHNKLNKIIYNNSAQRILK